VIYQWDPQLSDREVHFIGLIFIHFASLEHLIFSQTLESFFPDDQEAHPLPKEMSNIQFTGVLDLWKRRVADVAMDGRSEILLKQYEAILELKDARDALAHGMWHWSADDLGRISTVRVKKREVITTHFSAEALGEIASKLATINFNVRFPAGAVDRARLLTEQGGYISRRAMAMLTGAATDEDGYPTGETRGTSGQSGDANG
jgi:hypothetical protein